MKHCSLRVAFCFTLLHLKDQVYYKIFFAFFCNDPAGGQVRARALVLIKRQVADVSLPWTEQKQKKSKQATGQAEPPGVTAAACASCYAPRRQVCRRDAERDLNNNNALRCDCVPVKISNRRIFGGNPAIRISVTFSSTCLCRWQKRRAARTCPAVEVFVIPTIRPIKRDFSSHRFRWSGGY